MAYSKNSFSLFHLNLYIVPNSNFLKELINLLFLLFIFLLLLR